MFDADFDIEEQDAEAAASWRSSRQEKWRRFQRHVELNYHAPDMDGLRIVSAAAAAHTLLPRLSPIWLFVIGASGTGKSSLVGSVMHGFPYYNPLSNITAQTFMSGLQLGKAKKMGLLERLGPSILFWVSDLSSITSMKEDARQVVMAQLREIYDGFIHKDYGNGKTETWQGKCTLLAGCTPSVESLWALGRDLGERFLNVRWQHGDDQELGIAAALMRDEGETKMQTTHLAREWAGDLIALQEFVPMLDEATIRAHRLDAMAATVAKLRVSIIRDRANKTGHITEIGTPEGPGRIIKTLTGIAVSHAALMGRTEIGEEELRLAERVARESVPGRRALLLTIFAESDKRAMSAYDAQTEAGKRGWPVHANTIRTHLEDLVALGVMQASEFSGQKFFTPTEWWHARKELLGWA